MRVLFAAFVAVLVSCNLNQQGFLAAGDVGDLTFAPAPRVPFNQQLDLACGAVAAEQASATPFLRHPYLQRVSSSGAMLLWTTDSADEIEVRVAGPDGALVTTAAAAVDASALLPRGDQYVSSLAALEPDRTYCYEIWSRGQRIAGPLGFKTAPPTGADSPVAFVAIGDLGESQPDQYFVREQLYTVDADFSVITGDVAYNDGLLREFEDHFFGMYEDWLRHVPAFPASGNHDYHTRSAAVFREVFDLPTNGGPGGWERWYSFDWGPVHMVVLDTELVGAEQAEWLEADLADTEQPWRIAAYHRPAYSSGAHGSDPAVREAFSPIFEAEGVQLVLAGHDHHYERTTAQNGVTYVLTGAGGRGTRDHGWSDFTAFAARVAHFVYITIDGDELTIYAIDAAGQVFDTARLRSSQ